MYSLFTPLSHLLVTSSVLTQDGTKAIDPYGQDDVTFEGKYTNSYCGGSRSEALSIAAGFTLVNRDLNREKCLSMLLESTLTAECESIQGKYNLFELVQERRRLVCFMLGWRLVP